MLQCHRFLPSTLGGLLFLLGGLTACSNKSTSSVGAPSVDPNQIIILKVSGTTFLDPLYQKWIQDYSTSKDKQNIHCILQHIVKAKNLSFVMLLIR